MLERLPVDLSSRWGRGAVILGGVCLAGGVAFAWYYYGRKSTPALRSNASSTSTSGRPTATVAPLAKLPPGMESSLTMKENGNDLFKAGRYAAAAEAFGEAITLCPPTEKKHLAVCHQNRAAAYDRLGRREESIKDCTAALEYNPQYYKAVARRAKALLQMDNAEAALDDLMRANLLDPVATTALKSEIEKASGMAAMNYIDYVKRTRPSIPVREESILMWRSSYVNDPVLKDLNGVFVESSPYHRALQAIKDRRYEEVVPLVEEDLTVAESTTEKLRDYILIARFSLMKENLTVMKDRLDSFEKLWLTLGEENKKDETNRRLRAMFFLLRAALKMISRSLAFEEDFLEAVSLDTRNVDVYIGASMLLAETGQLSAAIDYLERLEKIAPTHRLAKHLKANYELALKASVGDVNGVMIAMQKADQLLQENQDVDPIIYLVTGRLYYAAQNKQLAITYFQKAAEALPNCAAPLFYLAIASAEDLEGSPEQLEKLKEDMKKCVSKESANPDALSVMARIAQQTLNFEEAEELYEKCISMCPVRSGEATVIASVTELVQVRSIRRAMEAMKGVVPPVV